MVAALAPAAHDGLILLGIACAIVGAFALVDAVLSGARPQWQVLVGAAGLFVLIVVLFAASLPDGVTLW